MTTVLSFRVDQAEADAARTWAERLGIDRSALLRAALRAHLVRLAAEQEVAADDATPADDGGRALAGIADWAPAEGWSDWE